MLSSYKVGGTVTGLGASQVVLAISGGASATVNVATDGAFTFPTGLGTGQSYAVAVQTQPSGEVCGVINASGTTGTSDVTNVTVRCSSDTGFLYGLANNQIYSYSTDPNTGAPTAFGAPLAVNSTGTSTPAMLWSRLTASPAGDYLYVDGSTNDGNANGSVLVYAVDRTNGALTQVGAPVATGVEAGVVAVSSNGFVFVYVANGAVIGHPGVPAGTASLQEYAIHSDGTLGLVGAALTFPPLNGAPAETNVAVTPDGRFIYVLSNSASVATSGVLTLSAYAIDSSTGALTAGPAMTLSAADIRLVMDPLGRFLYFTNYTGSTFSAATVVMPYSIDSSTGALTAVGTGTPVASNAGLLAPEPFGNYLYVGNNLNFSPAQDAVQALSVDPTGVVSTDGSIMQTTPSGAQPMQLVCDTSGRFVYMVSSDQQNSNGTLVNSQLITTFSISTAAGTAGQLISNTAPLSSQGNSSPVIAYVPGVPNGG